jgi:large subunit ribosomal protein L24
MASRIKKGDEVSVMTGDSRGSRGRVLLVDISKGRAVVEGVNVGVRHSKASGASEGGRLQREFSIHLSNLAKV